MGLSRCCTRAVAVLCCLHALCCFQFLTAAAAPQQAAACPVHYSRHSISDIRSKTKLPYLLGGIYDDNRRCPNCRRGGLWSEFCGFKNLEKMQALSQWWRMQVCNTSTVNAAIDAALRQNNAADLLTTTPCDLWAFMRGRTTWVIGDSMAKDLFRALRCFMIEFQDLKTYHASSNTTAMHFLQNIPGHGEAHCAHMYENTRLCQIHAIEGDLFVAEPSNDRTQVGGVLPLLQKHLAIPDDLFVVHFGLWHGETRQEAYKTYLDRLGRYYVQNKSQYPYMMFMETPKQHFDSDDGDYKVPWIKSRTGPWTCHPIKGVSIKADGSLSAETGNELAQYVAKGAWRNQHAREVLSKYDLPLIPVYNVTVPAWNFHRSNLAGQECSHYCHPSIPQFWIWHLLNTLRQRRVPAVADPRKQKLQPGRVVAYERDETKFGTPVPTLAMMQDDARQKYFWDWLFGRNKYALKDGVLVPLSASSSRNRDSITPWERLQQLVDGQALQEKSQQADSSALQQPVQRVQQEKSSKQQQAQVQERGSRRQQDHTTQSKEAVKQGILARLWSTMQQQEQHKSEVVVTQQVGPAGDSHQTGN